MNKKPWDKPNLNKISPSPYQTILLLLPKYRTFNKITSASGIDRSTVRRIASGEIQNPTYRTMQKLIKIIF